MSYKFNLANPSDSPLIISAYSPKVDVSINFPAESDRTKQSFKDECDINVLMSRYMTHGQVPAINERAPQYLDVSGIEFQNAMEFVAGAQTMFNELPASLRNRFDNDPAAFLDFCSADKNRPEMQKLGLLKPEAEWVKPIPASEILAAPAASPSVVAGENAPA